MKKFLLGAVGPLRCVGVAAPASAADLAARPIPRRPPMIAAIYDWSGFYIGLNGGWRSHKCWAIAPPPWASFMRPRVAMMQPAAWSVVRSAIAGRAGGWVFGLEAQGDWADLGARTQLSCLPEPSRSGKSVAGSMRFGLFTGQVGYAWNNALLYREGRRRRRRRQATTSFPLAGRDDSSANETRWGGTVGAGLEFGFAPNWSVASSTTICSWAPARHLHDRHSRA